MFHNAMFVFAACSFMFGTLFYVMLSWGLNPFSRPITELDVYVMFITSIAIAQLGRYKRNR